MYKRQAKAWFAASTAYIDVLYEVEAAAARDLERTADALSDATRQSLYISLGVTLAVILCTLLLARSLLSPDGAILISIDDHESANLKKICDEVFGESNYLNQFAWVSNITGRQISGRGAAKTWESVLAYARDIDACGSLSIDIRFAREKMPDAYKGFRRDVPVSYTHLTLPTT